VILIAKYLQEKDGGILRTQQIDNGLHNTRKRGEKKRVIVPEGRRVMGNNTRKRIITESNKTRDGVIMEGERVIVPGKDHNGE
jgi:hypothetical protein